THYTSTPCLKRDQDTKRPKPTPPKIPPISRNQVNNIQEKTKEFSAFDRRKEIMNNNKLFDQKSYLST
ncbi:MAG TPA: hypothetical protein VFS97_01245, partial [Nitrososphaeraceae archaeon]|nr:hypothetical protein [Nitrososphaeraceae archaeon]